MSWFWLKMIALLAMTVDHVGLVFGWQGWDLLPFDSSWLRTVGRISFPLFAFCVAQGWKHTRNKARYFRNLIWGAAASQIPFTLAFYGPNFRPEGQTTFVFQLQLWYLPAAVAAAGLYWYYALHGRRGLGWIPAAMAALLPALRLRVGGTWILCEKGNVLYTFLTALFCLFVVERWSDSRTGERAALLVAVSLLLMTYGLYGDYGSCLVGVALILGFALLETRRQQAAFLAAWSAVYYGVLLGSWTKALACALAGVCILLHDPDAPSRLRAKKLFYWYYPGHLLILGFVNGFLRWIALR